MRLVSFAASFDAYRLCCWPVNEPDDRYLELVHSNSSLLVRVNELRLQTRGR